MILDLRHLLRTLRRSPASAAAAVLTLSLTLGAGASIFAIVDAVLLTPPPFTDPESLVLLGERPVNDSASSPRAANYGTFGAWRTRAASLAALEAFDGTNLTLTGLGTAERVSATNATPGFLALLGVTPEVGRSFDQNDVGQPLIIVSHGFWRSTLGADTSVIGRQLVLGGQAHTIIGVLPERFFFALNDCDIWRLLPAPVQAAQQGFRVRAVARLRPGVSAASLTGALDEVSRLSSPPSLAAATPIATAISGDATGTLQLLAGAAAIAVLIAFANLAGLLIVRSIDRRRELSVRTALGARRAEIAKLLLLEAETLVALGVAGGVLLALWTTPVAGRLALEQFGAVANRGVAVSWTVVGTMAIVSILSAAICGLLPALMAARWNIVDMLRRGTTAPPRELALRRIFVSGVVALAFVLLVSVTLLGRSLFSVLTLDPGFNPGGVLTLQVALPSAQYDDGRVASFYSTLQSALRQRLGSGAVSYIDEIPLTGDRGRTLVTVPETGGAREAVVRSAATGYFDVMRMALAAGRGFDQRDNAAAPARIVITESLAASLFQSEQPVGRRVRLARLPQTAEVIGIVRDVRHPALDETVAPTVYLSALQAPSRGSVLVVRSALPDAGVIATVREEVARLDRDLPVYQWRSMKDVIDASPGVPARRVLTATLSAFALLAVVLGAIGLYGVAAHDVVRRRAELALRIALGADPNRLMAGTLTQSGWIVGYGLAAGGVLSIWTTRVLLATFASAGRIDVVGIAVAAGVLVAAGVGAVLPAAIRAARTDPLDALRAE